ncbi:MarR family transcriptional regulator [Halocynthiibacter sp. C4]|uniref:MarR family winged helix-turn-helix transcriptional regulator n=1 Tax=Halocynthiibacter sp. C4 TaxID=2992758 RepID=UPI00237ABCF6|nr:MarR family transcriptional regulator [Halocynthiibacter sp. C4]MDE0588366.1 MarR family transcriptional regulator [Halocynthiibacter sp. C4]
MDDIDRIAAQWRRERPDLDVEPMILIGRLSRIAAIFSAEMGKTFAKYDLNGATFDVLATLRRAGEPYSLTPNELLANMMISSGTLTNRIDQLVKMGLVERVKNPKDGRSVVVRITPSGFARIDRVVTEHVATQARILARFPAENRVEMNFLLTELLDGLSQGDETS